MATAVSSWSFVVWPKSHRLL